MMKTPIEAAALTGPPLVPKPHQTKEVGKWCLHCAQSGSSCCQGHEIYITPGDCSRIRDYLRHADFYEYQPCRDHVYSEQDEDPLWKKFVFRTDGSRRVVRWKPNGDCLFLESDGCRLPLNVRPLICRLHPRLYTAAGVLDQWDSSCPAVGQDRFENLEQSIAGTAKEEAMQWHHLLYHEIVLEGLSNENRPDL